MTLVFQIIAIAVVLIAAILLVRGSGAKHQAMRRILMVVFLLAVASSVFFPQAWTWVANLVGIGRGADLLLYLSVFALIVVAVTTYRRFRQTERDITTLARAFALAQARPPEEGDEGRTS